MADRAAVFVDGRYTIQVRAQVDAALFEICDLVVGGVPAWIEANTRPGQVIGYDARLHSPDALGHLRNAAIRSGATLKPVDPNPLDVAWGVDRPAQPAAPVRPHALAFAGEESAAKRARLGEGLVAKGAEAAVLTAPASIAWLFNVRGGDVSRTPLPLAQAILNRDGSARLFLEPVKVTPELPAWLGNGVSLETPADLPGALAGLKDKVVLIDPAQSPAFYFDALEAAGARVLRGEDPCALPRACKNPVEIAGSRSAHVRDGVALTRFLHWVATEAQTLLPDEIEVASRLEAFREEVEGLADLSFDTIAAALGNAALPHYHPTEKTNARTAPGTPWPSGPRAGRCASASPWCSRATWPWRPCASLRGRRARRWTPSPGPPSGPADWTTTTAPATASASSWGSTRARTASPRPRIRWPSSPA